MRDRSAGAAPSEPGETRRILPQTVSIPAGRLLVKDADGAEKAVEILPFQLGRMPATNRDYAFFISSGRAAAPPWWNDPDFASPRQPVVGVTWEEAMQYCAWLSELAEERWRLPTQVEWEFAASGGLDAPRTAWGDAIPAGEIPEGPLRGPWEAGRGTPNAYGLFDMGTIVHEWCADWREAVGSSGGPRRRASRGGSWRHKVRWSSPSASSSLPPEYRYSDYGFRVLREGGGASVSDESGSTRGTVAAGSITAVILAAGASSRMGRPKQLLTFRGRPMLRHIVEEALSSYVSRVVVVLGARAEEIAPALDGLSIQKVWNPDWERGLSTSLRAGIELLAKTPPRADGVLFLLGDQPLVTAESLNRLLAAYDGGGRCLAATDRNGRLGVPAVFSEPFLEPLRRLEGDSGARQVLEAHAAEVTRVLLPEAGLDVDTPEDYRRLIAE